MSMRVYILWHQHIERKSKAWIKFSFLFFCWIVQLLLVVIVEEERCEIEWTIAREKEEFLLFVWRVTFYFLSQSLSLKCQAYIYIHSSICQQSLLLSLSLSLFGTQHNLCLLIIKLKVNIFKAPVGTDSSYLRLIHWCFPSHFVFWFHSINSHNNNHNKEKKNRKFDYFICKIRICKLSWRPSTHIYISININWFMSSFGWNKMRVYTYENLFSRVLFSFDCMSACLIV
jgi:hypothetical protein